MSSKPDAWMPLWIGDYRKDTTRLTLEQHGAYLKLIMDYWVNGAPPNDDSTICRILGVERRVWQRLKPAILPFFDISGANLTHKRIEIEKAGACERSGKNAARAKKGAEARWGKKASANKGVEAGDKVASPHAEDASSNAPSSASGMLEAMPKQCPSPVTYPSPTEKASATPDQRAWRDGVALLVSTGGLREKAARSFFGKLLKDNALEPHELLPSVVKAETNGTLDPRSYLTQAARALGARKSASPETLSVDGWGADEWRAAMQMHRDGRWGERMGPKPGEVGCMVPTAILAEFGFGQVIPMRGAVA